MTMADHSDEDSEPGAYASPACFMHEVDCDHFGLASGAASVERDNIMRWRKNERERLIAQRLAISNDERVDHARHIVANLDILLPDLAGLSVSLYWPFRGEPDLRGWAAAIGARGATCALPVVVEKNAPLIFRLWRIGEPLALGFWNIPFPANSPELAPDVVIAPVVGFDQKGYRLGYGGAFYDRNSCRPDEKAPRLRHRLQPSRHCDDISASPRYSDGCDRYGRSNRRTNSELKPGHLLRVPAKLNLEGPKQSISPGERQKRRQLPGIE